MCFQVDVIVVFVSFSGRLDHILANINTLHKGMQLTRLPIYLINGDTLACMLDQVNWFYSVSFLLKYEEMQEFMNNW